jgi:GNAT superfamily N-acetyltransferase
LSLFSIDDIQYIDTDESWRERFAQNFGEKAARHLHFADGFTISAVYQEKIVGFTSTYWSQLQLPFADTMEGYIDILEVTPPFRRHGIATQLVNLSVQRVSKRHAYQLRAWSSEDKLEVLPMWKKLGFGLCPATTYPRSQEVHGFFVIKVLG